MGKLLPKRKELRIERIRTAALEMFAEHGYEKTSMEQIAERSDFSVRTLYNYFESKADILVDSLNAHAMRYQKEAFAYIEKSQGSLADRLTSLIMLFYTTIPHDSKLMGEVLSAILSSHSKIRGKLNMPDRMGKEITDRLLEKCKQDDIIPEGLDLHKCSEFIALATSGIDMKYRLGIIPDLPTLEKKAYELIDTIIRGMQPCENTQPV